MRSLAPLAAVVLLGALAPAVQAGVRLSAEATPSARRPTGRIVFAVTLENELSPEMGTLILEQADVSAERRVEVAVELAPRARKRFLVAFDTLPGGHDFDFRFETEAGPLAATTIRVPTTGARGELVGVLGQTPGWLRRQAGAEISAVELEPKSLPSSASTWPTVDSILWPDPRSSDLDEERVAALKDWVLAGGRLLTGTAADQPRALEELGFEDWPLVSDHFRHVGFGEAARSPLDLARSEAPAGLGLRSRLPKELVETGWWADAPVFTLAALALVDSAGSVPTPPLLGVGLVLVAFWLGSGPGEWLVQRWAVRKGRRSTRSSIRRGVLLTLAVGAILVQVGALREDVLQVVRINVIDVDPASGAARGEAHVALRTHAGGWMELQAPRGTHLSSSSGSVGSGYGRWDTGSYEPSRIFQADLQSSAKQHRARSLPESWSIAMWRMSFEPDPASVAAGLAMWRGLEPAPHSTTVAGEDLGPPLSDEAFQAAVATSRERATACFQVEDRPTLLRCAVASCDAVHRASAKRRGNRPPVSAWPIGTGAWIAVTETTTGPELLIDGAPALGREFTVWRVLPREDPS